MAERPEKMCARCGRTMQWRSKWARNWDQVKYCSDSCRRSRTTAIDERLEQAIVRLLDGRSRDSSI
ncbi:MAG: DUF2256 domain-containing protein, partial [Actinomycetota bacterium]